MNKKKVLTIIAIIFAAGMIAAAVLLTFGSRLFRNEVLDQQLEVLVSSMNSNDPEPLKDIMHPTVYSEDVDAWFAEIHPLWQNTSTEAFKAKGINISSRVRNGQEYKSYRGIWTVKMGENTYELTIIYESDDKGSGGGALSFYRTEGANAFTVVAYIIYFLFVIFTVVDIIRSKPRLYGLFILLSIMLFFQIRFGEVRITLPLGAIIYWLARKRLLQAKNKSQTGIIS